MVTRLALLTLGTLASLGSLARPAAADSCDPTRVMVVLDKSSSMQTGVIGDQTKWQIAVNGLDAVLGAYDAKAEFGLMTFPHAAACAPGALDVTPATTTAARHVILITDGWQWCSPYDPATRYDGVDSVGRLQTAGVTTWVVGFGADVDAAALNQMAVVAGTARPNCNPSNTDPAAPNQCYFQVDNAADLVAALNTIAGVIAADEICDGIDNDCDGLIDEDLVRDCSNTCGAGTESCVAGEWKGCNAPVSAPETCDGNDNDCDGTIDNGDVCGAPETEPTGAAQAGCGCSSGPLDAGGAGSILALGLAVTLATRRRRR
ncbi:MAG: VWA domain-containing protein [Proteobacteria bacterium]|nr:VWA domain-containing protein [Pseudomonadota bacterium]